MNHPDKRGAGQEQKLVERYDGLVLALARGLRRRLPPQVELDDLVACGRVGLLEASRRYEGRAQSTFKTFAYYRIRGAMIDFLRRERRHDRVVRMAAVTEEAMDATVADFTTRIGEAPEAGPDGRGAALVELIDTLLVTRQVAARAPQLDEIADPTEDQATAYARREQGEILRRCVALLSERDRELIEAYFFAEERLSVIGERRGLSRSRISRLISRACQRLGVLARRAGLGDSEAHRQDDVASNSSGQHSTASRGGNA